MSDNPVEAKNQKTFTISNPDVKSYLVDPGTGVLSTLKSLLSVEISNKGNSFVLSGTDAAVASAALNTICDRIFEQGECSSQEIMGILQEYKLPPKTEATAPAETDVVIQTKRKKVCPSTAGQTAYVKHLFEKEMAFGIGPAGTGKTYLAIAVAAHFLESKSVDKIILTRPAVEAGEKLGYLPGDMKDKVDPYMQPLYDALNEFLGSKAVEKMIEEKVIEISPIAFMRGRTLKNAFVVLDEAQNCTEMQMKMFLTRMGEGSHMVITGDLGQSDLPKGVKSGLLSAKETLSGIPEIGFSELQAMDIVRHPLVAKIIQAFEKD